MTDRRRAWPHVTVGAVADAVSLLLAAGAALSFLLGHGGWTLAASCAALLAGTVALVLGWRRRHPVAAAVAVLVIAVGAAGLGTFSRGEPAVTLAFDPQADPVPYCRSYEGTGRIPDGHQVLLFDRATADVTGAYYFHGQAARTDHGWLARGVEIGRLPTAAEPELDRGVTFDVYAQLVAEETARILRDRDNIVIFPRDEQQPPVWLLRELPGRTAATLRVTRGAAPGECD